MTLLNQVNEIVLITILTAFQVIAIYFVLKLWRFFDKRVLFLVISAFAIIFLIAIISILNVIGITSPDSVFGSFERIYLPLIFWVLLSIGFGKIYLKDKLNKQ